MGGSMSLQQRQQIATYRTRFIFGESDLKLMNDADLNDNEVKCRNVVGRFDLNKKTILNEILQKIETNPNEIIDNNGILLCNSEQINNLLQSHAEKSPIYIKEQQSTLNQQLALNQQQSAFNQPNQQSSLNQPNPQSALNQQQSSLNQQQSPFNQPNQQSGLNQQQSPFNQPQQLSRQQPSSNLKQYGGKSEKNSKRKQKSAKLYY